MAIWMVALVPVEGFAHPLGLKANVREIAALV